jgi:acyl-CoA thioester hydrolase
VRYLREVHLDTPLRIKIQLLDYDEKRVHLFEQLLHATEGWVSSTSENMTVHVDMTAKKVVPFPRPVLDALERMRKAHAALPWPNGAGRKVAMPIKK